ncbi:MAG: ArsR/SmtB family transcription factor [Acidiferrobacterales bacterium]
MKSEYAQSLPDSWAQFARFFSALGDPTRQKILLVFEQNEEICVNEIARLFELSRPAISHHLKVLRNADLLLSEKRGKEVYYRVNYPYCAQVLRLVHRFVASKVNGEEAIDPFSLDRRSASK